MEGITSIAFSLASFTIKEFQPAANYALKLIQQLIENPLPEATLLNVNIPPFPSQKSKESKSLVRVSDAIQRIFNKDLTPEEKVIIG